MNYIDSEHYRLISELCPKGVGFKELGTVCKFRRGTSITKKDIVDGNVPVVAGGQQPAYYHNVPNRTGKTIVVSSSGAYAGFVSYWEVPVFLSDSFSVDPELDILIPKYVFYFLKNIQKQIHSAKKGSGVPHVHGSDLSKIRIPIPPIEVQEEIVRILDSFAQLETELETELEARRKQYEYYRSGLFVFNDKVKYLKLDEIIVSLKTGLNPRKNFVLNTPDAKNYYVTVRELNGTGITFLEKTDKVNDEALRRINGRSNLEVGDILFSGTGTIGRTALITESPTNWNIKEGVYVIKPERTVINSKFLLFFLNSEEARKQIQGKVVGLPVMSIPMAELRKIRIPVPEMAEQERIVSILDKFAALVNDLSIGLPAELALRRSQYEYYRGKLLTFKEYVG